MKKEHDYQKIRHFAGLTFAFLILLFLWHGPILWLGQVFSGGDIINEYYPTIHALKADQFLGWNNYTFSGWALMGDIQSATLYPPNWLHFLIADSSKVFTVLALFHYFWGAAGMFLFARCRFDILPSAVAAFLWAFGGYHLLRLTNGVVIFPAALCWMPWMWLAAEKASLAKGPALKWIGLLGLFGGMQILAGAPQIVQISWAGIFLWMLFRVIFAANNKTRFQISGAFILSAILAVGIAFPQLAESLRLQAETFPRGGEDKWNYIKDGSLQPRVYLTWLMPGFFGPGNSESIYWGSTVGYAETNGYMGILPLMLALLGAVLFWKKGFAAESAPQDNAAKRWGITLLVMIFLAIMIALGEHGFLFPLLFQFVPGFDMFRVPARWSLWAVAPIGIFAAWGLQMLLQAAKSPDKPDKLLLRAWIAVSATIVVIFMIIMTFVDPILPLVGEREFLRVRTPQMQQILTDLNRANAQDAAAWAFWISVFSLVVSLLFLYRKLAVNLCLALIVGIILLDLRLFWVTFNQTLPHDAHPRELESEFPFLKIKASEFHAWYYRQSEVVQNLTETDPVLGRLHYNDSFISWQYIHNHRELSNDRPAVLGLEVTRGYNPLQLRGYVEDYYASMPLIGRTDPGAFMSQIRLEDRRFLDAYNVTDFLTYSVGPETELDQFGLTNNRVIVEFDADVRGTELNSLHRWTNPHARGWAWLSSEESFLDAEPDESLGSIEINRQPGGAHSLSIQLHHPAFLHVSSPDFSGWKLQGTGPAGEIPSPLNSRTVFLDTPGEYQIERQFHLIATKWWVIFIGLLGFSGSFAAIFLSLKFRDPEKNQSE